MNITLIKPNEIYNSWKIIELHPTRSTRVKCLCIGCNQIERWIQKRDLILGKTKSCGCQKINNLRKVIGNTKKSSMIPGAIFFQWKVLVLVPSNSIQTTFECTICSRVKRASYRRILDNRVECDCSKIKSQIKIGVKYNNWTVNSINDSSANCICICGVVRKLNLFTVLNGDSKSCGCQTKTIRSQTNKQKYGSENLFQDPIVRNKGRQVQIDSGYIHIINGKSLSEHCKETNTPLTCALHVLNSYGEQACLDYIKTYKPTISYVEYFLIDIIKDSFPDVKKYNREPIEFKLNRKPDFRLEKDERVLYINGDGLFYHSENSKHKLIKGNNRYHINLYKSFSDNNQTIYQFREDELRDKPEIVKSLILNYFGIYQNKIGARKCEVKQVSSKDANQFFEENHLMGSYKSSTPFGLYYDDQLIMCLSVRVKDKILDMARLATKNNYMVQGGLSKLLKYIKTKYINITTITSFCDFRYATGRGYQKVGFKLESTTLGWKWTDKFKTYNRLQCRANMDERKLTQAQHAEELNWCKIYDAGQGKYVMEIK